MSSKISYHEVNLGSLFQQESPKYLPKRKVIIPQLPPNTSSNPPPPQPLRGSSSGSLPNGIYLQGLATYAPIENSCPEGSDTDESDYYRITPTNSPVPTSTEEFHPKLQNEIVAGDWVYIFEDGDNDDAITILSREGYDDSIPGKAARSDSSASTLFPIDQDPANLLDQYQVEPYSVYYEPNALTAPINIMEIVDFADNIGGGAFGDVHSGIVRVGETTKFAALKIMKSANGQYALAYQEEVQRTQILYDHQQVEKIPGMPTVYGFTEFNSDSIIGMKFCNQSDLKTFLQKKLLYFPKRAEIAIGVGRSIANLNCAGYVHHDIKLNNILVNAKDDLHSFYLGDFGFVDPRAQMQEIPRIFNRPYAPLKALKAEAASSPQSAEIWNDSKYDDVMYGYLLWQLFTDNFNKFPWSDPSSTTATVANHLAMGDECLFEDLPAGGFNDWIVPPEQLAQVQAIIRGLITWDEGHITAEEATKQLEALIGSE